MGSLWGRERTDEGQRRKIEGILRKGKKRENEREREREIASTRGEGLYGHLMSE
jgi:hypothetical protein